ncbi:O-antigen ligase family protein [Pseudoalteromonas tetraodonis]|uniref:O-antigen ligase family protein n=1 Tax=Pseudoalteromonas tetraodonis TaxID=43659 RepID=UPI003D03F3EE
MKILLKPSYWHFSLLTISLFLCDAVFRIRAYEDKTLDFQVLIKILVYITLFIVGSIMFKKHNTNFKFKHNVFIFLLIIYFLLSSFWSVNTLYGIVSSFSILSYFIFITSFTSKYGEQILLKFIFYALLIFMVVSFIFYFFYPSVGSISYWEFDIFVESGRMSGIAGSANNLGRISCLAFIISFFFYRQGGRSKAVFLLLFLSISSLILSLNRSSMLMVLFAFFILTFSKRYKQLYLMSLIILGIFCIFLVFNLDNILIMTSRSGNIEEMLTFTGRTYIWNVVLELLEKKPIFGFGYASSIFILPQYENQIGFTASHAHNMILQVLLYGGGVALAGFFASILMFFTLKLNKLQVCLFVFVFYNGLLESGAFNGLVNITTLTLFIAYNINNKRIVN